ncbi:hypothetical protein [uncultured Ruthenibacterium sp.]|uniref:hypothetical protein n=1 Tax=uncultured Ruthenibacterium sp. TaxID=1905347 RepID=UPI00349E6F0E
MKSNKKISADQSMRPIYAKRAIEAARNGNLRPALFYTEQEQTPCDAGVWESRQTVNRKLKEKEEFPLG